MLLINFTHPVTPAHVQSIEVLTGQRVERVIEQTTHFDTGQPFAGQVAALVDAVGLTSHEWQTLPILVNLPSLNFIAATLLAELHGRMGYFPPIVRLRPVQGSLPPQFEVAEIINLQAVRDEARGKR